MGSLGYESTDRLQSRSGNIVDDRVMIFGNPLGNVGEILRVANEGSAVNGGSGIISRAPNFMRFDPTSAGIRPSFSGGLDFQTPLGGASVAGNLTPLLVVGVGAAALIYFLRR
jgi:hypothetical protein